MTKKAPPNPETVRLIEATREAHEVLADLKAERKAIEDLVENASAKLAEELQAMHDGFVAALVEQGLENYRSTIEQAQEDGVRTILEGFDEMVSKLLIATKKDQRRGLPSIPDLVEQMASGNLDFDSEAMKRKVQEIEAEMAAEQRLRDREERRARAKAEAKSRRKGRR